MSFFFGRKQPTPKPALPTTPAVAASEPTPQARPEDKRQHYRVHQTTNTVLGATYVTAGGEKYYGECEEVSMGGAGVYFPTNKDPKLAVGVEVDITFQVLSRPDGIQARAAIRSVTPAGAKGTRYGFQFTNVVQIYAQIDSFYARWFNRRKHVRVLPDLAQKIRAKLTWPKGEVDARVHDVSMGGVGLSISAENLKLLEGVEDMQVAFQLPDEPGEINVKVKVKVRWRDAQSKQPIVGVEFEADGGIEQFKVPLRRFIDRRLAHISKWNAAMSAARKTL